MPRIPLDTAYADSGAVSALNPVRGMSPAEAAIPGQQLQEFGNALTGAGTTAVGIAADMQDYVNQVSVMDAMNQARERAIDLTYNPEGGYQSIKGAAAINRPDGVALPDEYGDKYKNAIGEISAKLTNERQREDFNLRAAQLQTSFRSDVARHMEGEFKQYTLSVADGAIKLGTDEAKRNWDKPAQIGANLLQVKTAVVRAGQIHGWSGNETDARMKIATSNVHATVVESALQAGNATYATQYVQKYSNEMTADDLLKANGQISKVMDSAMAWQSVTLSTKKFADKIQPTDTDRAFNILLGTESGGKQFGKDGQPLTSKAGAIGIAQVMPKTAPEAAKLAGLPWDEERYKTDPEYNRALGKAYFTKQLQTFGGNLPMAYAAYNAGPGALTDAMLKASLAGDKGAWLSKLPAETQAYVRKNMAEYGSGGGAPKMPSEMEFVNDAVERLGPNARPEAVKLTRETAKQQFILVEKALKDRDEQATAAAMRALEQNGGRFSALPLAVRSAIPPKEVDNLMNYGSRIYKGDDNTNPAVYLRLTDDATLKGMSDNAFYQLRSELSASDFQHFAQERAKLITGKGKDQPGDLNTAAINSVLGDRLRMMGRDPTPKDGSQESQLVGAMHKTVRESILNAQAATGKKMTDAEVEKHIDKLFATSVTFRNTFLGMNLDTSSMRLMGMTPNDIPSDVRDKLKADFAARGLDKPSDADLLGAYWKLKLAQR